MIKAGNSSIGIDNLSFIAYISNMRWILVLFFCLPLFANTPNPTDACKKEVEAINKQIENLSKERDQHAQKSVEYQRQGNQWQYSTGRVQEAYDAWAKADAERKQMNDLQLQIDELNRRKARIFLYYPELQSP
jgi:hypothetical protein